jgi:hypothetical protein
MVAGRVFSENVQSAREITCGESEMPTELLIAVIIASAILLAAGTSIVMVARLGLAIRIVAALAFVPLALISAWGFAAAMEPGDFHVVWRVLYAAVFVACLGAIGRLAFARSDRGRINQN